MTPPSRAARSRRRRALAVALLVLTLVGLLVALHVAREPDAAHPLAAPSRSEPVTVSPSTNQRSGGPLLRKPPGPLGGYLLIADRGNNRMLLVDGNKQVLWRYPGKHAPTFPFRYDDDAFFGPGYSSIITNQEDQDTIEVVSFPGGKVLWHYGHVDRSGSSPGYLHTPDDAYLLPNGRRVVADVGNCRVVFISRQKRIVKRVGTTGLCEHNPPRALASPNGDTPYSRGRLLVTEIGGSWIDAIDKRGKFLWSVQAPTSYPSDAQWLGHGKILLAGYSSPGKVMIMKKSGRILWSYGPASGSGSLDHPSLALKLPNGMIAVNDDFHDRIVVINPTSNKIVWQYGHLNRPGIAHGFLHIPDGMDFLPYRMARDIPKVRKLISHAER